MLFLCIFLSSFSSKEKCNFSEGKKTTFLYGCGKESLTKKARTFEKVQKCEGAGVKRCGGAPRRQGAHLFGPFQLCGHFTQFHCIVQNEKVRKIHRNALNEQEQWNYANIESVYGSKVVHGWNPGSTTQSRRRVRVGVRDRRGKFIKWKYFALLTIKGRRTHTTIKLQQT